MVYKRLGYSPVKLWVLPLSCSTPLLSALLHLLLPEHIPASDAFLKRRSPCCKEKKEAQLYVSSTTKTHQCRPEQCRPSFHKHTHTCYTPFELQRHPQTLHLQEHTLYADRKKHACKWMSGNLFLKLVYCSNFEIVCPYFSRVGGRWVSDSWRTRLNSVSSPHFHLITLSKRQHTEIWETEINN